MGWQLITNICTDPSSNDICQIVTLWGERDIASRDSHMYAIKTGN